LTRFNRFQKLPLSKLPLFNDLILLLQMLRLAVHVCSALPKIIKTGFSAINLIYFFTAGPDEVYLYKFLILCEVAVLALADTG